MNFELIQSFSGFHHIALDHSLVDFFYDLGIAILGGAVAGYLSGYFSGKYVYNKVVKINEDARDLRQKNEIEARVEDEKKTECTKAFITTQMKLMLQMSSLKGLHKTMENMLDQSLATGKIRDFFPNGFDRGVFFKIQDQIVTSENLNFFTDYLVTPSSFSDVVIEIPFQIYDMSKFSEKEKLSKFFGNLSNHNKNYFDIVSLINRRNHIRDVLFLNTPVMDPMVLSSVIQASIKTAFDLEGKIKSLIDFEFRSFEEASQYILEIGLTKPIEIEKDDLGNPIFDER